jgi:hypothetical protein
LGTWGTVSPGAHVSVYLCFGQSRLTNNTAVATIRHKVKVSTAASNRAGWGLSMPIELSPEVPIEISSLRE